MMEEKMVEMMDHYSEKLTEIATDILKVGGKDMSMDILKVGGKDMATDLLKVVRKEETMDEMKGVHLVR